MFLACVAVNAEIGDMFLRITLNGEFVPVFVAFQCASQAPQALVCTCTLDAHCCFPFLVALSVVMTSRALAQVKKSSALCHTHVLSMVAERWVPCSVNS